MQDHLINQDIPQQRARRDGNSDQKLFRVASSEKDRGFVGNQRQTRTDPRNKLLVENGEFSFDRQALEWIPQGKIKSWTTKECMVLHVLLGRPIGSNEIGKVGKTQSKIRKKDWQQIKLDSQRLREDTVLSRVV